MRNTSVRRLVLTAATLGMLSGCSEFVLEGIISDRETARPLPFVKIDQEKGDGWKHVGDTDGRGRYWIMKDRVGGGGVMRFSKNGYLPTKVTEGDFLTGQSFLLTPSNGASDDGF